MRKEVLTLSYDTEVQPIEVLGLTPAVLHGLNYVAIALRPDPTNSFRSQTVVVTKEQAERLCEDIQHLLNQTDTIWD